MATGKRYYWIKLRDTFLTSDTIDFFMSQPEGANYVVLYQALCLKTINTEGRLERVIGEVVIPYDVDKIQRDCKWFSTDTIRIALGLYKKFGLIYEDQNGTLVLTNHSEMVGSETNWAAQKRTQRCVESGQTGGQLVDIEVDNVHPEIRDKDTRYKDTRDQILDTRDQTTTTTSGCGEPDRPNLNTIEAYASGNLQYLSPGNMEELVDFMNELPDEVIRYAIDIACANGVRKWGYVRSILQAWVEAGVKTLGAAKAETEKKPQSKSQAKPAAQDYQQHQYTDEDFKWNDLERLYGGG